MLNPERDPERDVDLQTLIFWVDCEFDSILVCISFLGIFANKMSKGEIVSVCVIGMVIGKTYFDVKANIDCDICYFDIVARILELIVVKFDF